MAVLSERLRLIVRTVDTKSIVHQNIARDIVLVESVPLDDLQGTLLQSLRASCVLLQQEHGEVVVSEIRAGDEGLCQKVSSPKYFLELELHDNIITNSTFSLVLTFLSVW